MTTQSTQITVDTKIEIGHIGESHALIAYHTTAKTKNGASRALVSNRYLAKVEDVDQICQQIYDNPVDPQVDPQYEHQHYSFTVKSAAIYHIYAESLLGAVIVEGKVVDSQGYEITPQRINLGQNYDPLALNLTGGLTLPILISMDYSTDTGIEDVTLDNSCLDIHSALAALLDAPGMAANISPIPQYNCDSDAYLSLNITFDTESYHDVIRDAVIAHKEACKQNPSLIAKSLKTIVFNAIIAPIVLPFAKH